MIIQCYIYDSIGTMSIHQIIASETGKIHQLLLQKGYELPLQLLFTHAFRFHKWQRQVVVYSEELHGKWCIVKYDQKPFPGMIQDLDETDVFVQCMHRVGHNRFVWGTVNSVLDKLATYQLATGWSQVGTSAHNHLGTWQTRHINKTTRYPEQVNSPQK